MTAFISTYTSSGTSSVSKTFKIKLTAVSWRSERIKHIAKSGISAQGTCSRQNGVEYSTKKSLDRSKKNAIMYVCGCVKRWNAFHHPTPTRLILLSTDLLTSSPRLLSRRGAAHKHLRCDTCLLEMGCFKYYKCFCKTVSVF